jgi:hypothetical protein
MRTAPRACLLLSPICFECKSVSDILWPEIIEKQVMMQRKVELAVWNTYLHTAECNEACVDDSGGIAVLGHNFAVAFKFG